ncbi:peptidoglycan D,D-transpeptidase FtsI family protein [Microbacterium sp. 22242]|uniref:peptidoglycan D,D-transpeptidase FtsI family protein n=1 Tax=Microbacterium sp. 22242 TaxID=3453896 RepID=UPI003F82BEBC
MTTRATRTPRRRTVIALAVILAVVCGFLVRLVDIQVVNAAANVKESRGDTGLGITRTLDGARGSILDQNGTVLAESQLVYDLQMDPSAMHGLETGKTKPKLPWAKAADKIAAITGQTGDEVRKIASDALAANPDSQYAEIKKGLSTEQFLKIRALGLDYLTPVSRSVRVYPNGAVAGNLIGFIAGNGDREGLEELQNSCLSATKGTETYLTGNDGVVIPGSMTEKPAVDGGTVKLTINTELQWYLQQMIMEEAKAQGAKAGTVTVVEVGTGKIRAAAEYPSVDPNNPGASDPDDRGSRIFSTSFEPGSTFKAITAAAVMEHANVNSSTSVNASSHEKFPNGAVINDAFEHPAYDYTLAGALIDSSNVALSKFGDMVTDQQRYDELVKFGVGSKTAIDFPGEASGIIHPVKDWDYQSHYTTTFGQYYTVTAPQVASAYQTIANGGVKVPLSLVESCTTANGKVTEAPAPKPQRVFDPAKDAELSRILENVAVQDTAVADQIKIPGYRIAIKTGTAQKPDPKTGAYKEGVYFTSMVGYAPAEHPQYVVVVTLDEPTRVTSSAATAPAFQKAMTQVLKTYRVQPSTDPMEPLLPKFKE